VTRIRNLEKGGWCFMAKLETITFAQTENEIVRLPENYTQVTGIYSAQIAPQFLTGADNVQHSPEELIKVEQDYVRQQDINFFRML
jgi:hypothetical protein